MKKTYSNPEIQVVEVASMQLLAGSEQIETKGSYGTGEGITLGSRQGWFDDGDDDE